MIVEIIAKIFAMMPRIDVYFDLFKDQKDVLDIRPLLVAIYKCIVEFNVKCVKWHGGLRGKQSTPPWSHIQLPQVDSDLAKGRKLLKEDPRTSFKDIFVKMTDASEEMRKQAEAIGLKRQVVAHNDLVDRLAKMEHDQQQGLKGLRDDLIQKRHEETSQQLELAARKAEEARLANEKVISEGKEKEKARKAQEESLKPFLQGSSLRQQLWRLLHEPPWSVIAESQVNGLIDMDSASKSPKGKYWQDGTYQMQYPVEDPVAEVFLTIDWKADTDPTHPSIKWVMDTPDSLFYPGKHVGRMEVKKSDFSSNYPPNLFDSRLKVYWESGTFSSIPNPRVGLLSSDGPLEEAMVPHILTCTLQSIAHILIMGPLSKSTPQTGFGWHDMDRGIARYFASNDEDVSMRACAFFSNAFTRDIEGLDDLSHMELLESCREASKMAIRELASFFKIDTEIAENADRDRSWVLDDSYAKASSQIDWVLQDRLWAGRIAQLARHERLIKASNCFQPPSKVSRSVISGDLSRRLTLQDLRCGQVTGLKSVILESLKFRISYR